MNLSRQIKNLRKEKGLSQEELAQRIYVSRQTISNWETERSYPDVQSLLLLSVLFEVSLDDLVKGDLEMMKQTVDAHRLNVAGWVMLVTMVLGGLTLLPSYGLFGLIGLVLPGALLLIGLGVSIYSEILKKRNNVKTFSEILSFMNEVPLDESKVQRERRRRIPTIVLMMVVSALLMVAVIFLGEFLFKLLVGA